MARVAVAAASQIAADAGVAVASLGGNAVDAAIAASFVSMTTEPGIVALGGGSYVTVSVPGRPVVVIDGYAEMPGRSAPPGRVGGAMREVDMAYGGGMTTRVGHGTVATPGAVRALGAASGRFGGVEWSTLIDPAHRWAQSGFPLSAPSAEYLFHAAEPIFSWHPESRAALLDDTRTVRNVGDVVHCEGLAETLTVLSDEGPDAFYTGTFGRRLAADTQAHDGLLDHDDLAAYEAVERDALELSLDRWTFATNPAPAIGGAVVAAVLALVQDLRTWDAPQIARFVDALHAVQTFRISEVDGMVERSEAVELLSGLAALGDIDRISRSPSTVHVSAVDDDGVACAITSSSGYGSGVVVPGTGVWLNNTLGEIDLLRVPLADVPPGTRLPSNMAPSVARRDDGAVLALGSPGASRISSAVAQVVFHHLCLGRSLTEAIEHPRLHVEEFDGRMSLAYEPGLDVSAVDGLVRRPFAASSMYFGGTQLASWDPEAGLFAAADHRRTGGVAVSD